MELRRCFHAPAADYAKVADHKLEFPHEHGVPVLGTLSGPIGPNMIFKKNMPANAQELADIAVKLKQLKLVVQQWVPQDTLKR